MRAERAKKNNGNENNILPPIASIIATNKEKIKIKFLILFPTFLLFVLTNQDNSKNTKTKMIIPVIITFI